jgi:uncharacterized lipoprotein YmbA
MRRRKYAIPIAMLTIALTAGCSVLSPRPDPTKYFVLTAIDSSGATQPASSAASNLKIGLGPVKLPDYLHHTEVVTRVAPNRLDLSLDDQWAEPLDDNFRRVLAHNLEILIGTSQIEPFPWYAENLFDYKIEVTVERFERDASGGTQLAASWIIRDGHNDKVLMTREANFAEIASGGIEGSAGALSADLGDLSKQIADAVIELNQRRRSRSST